MRNNVMSTSFEKLSNCRLFLLDMDGTLYLGDNVYEGAVDFVNKISARGSNYIYLTNNSSRAGIDYVNRLHKLGFPCEMDNLFTSSMATVRYLNEHHKGEKVYPVCTRAFMDELQRGGVEFSDTEASVVVVGFDTELTYEKLDKAVHFLRRGAAFIAANPDWVCPMPNDEVMPDCGSICALLTASSGREPFYIGKPNRSMVDIISAMTGIPNSEICCVGDRIYTDIAVGVNAGAVTALVMSGETTQAVLDESETKPDYVFRDVAQMAQYL